MAAAQNISELMIEPKWVRTTLIAWVFAAGIAALVSAPQSGSATSIAREYLDFQTICSVVEFQTDREFENLFDRTLVNKAVAAVIEIDLRERKLNFPVEFGRQCFPGKVGTAPRQLSFQFHLTLAKGPEHGPPVVMSLIVHSYYQDISRPPHNFPTAIGFCRSKDDLSNCLISHITNYSTNNVIEVIKRAQVLKGGNK